MSVIILELPSWTAFKATCITVKNLNCQYDEQSDRYELYGPDANGMVWRTTLLKDGGADQTDFETNYKTKAFNFAIGSRDYPAASSDFVADDDKFTATFPKATIDGQLNVVPTVTDVYYKFDHVTYFSGSDFWSEGAGAGDYVQVDVVDKDGIVPIPGGGGALFPAGTVLSTYVRGRYLNPQNLITTIQRPYWAKPPVGVYLRIRGTIINTTSDVTVYLNLICHKPI